MSCDPPEGHDPVFGKQWCRIVVLKLWYTLSSGTQGKFIFSRLHFQLNKSEAYHAQLIQHLNIHIFINLSPVVEANREGPMLLYSNVGHHGGTLRDQCFLRCYRVEKVGEALV